MYKIEDELIFNLWSCDFLKTFSQAKGLSYVLRPLAYNQYIWTEC